MDKQLVQLETEPGALYERVGGEPYFTSLVDRFYDLVQEDPLLRPLYPEDLGPPRRHLALFLVQYWGGPRTYSLERGHPRLRMRHVRFAIGSGERDAWLRHMRQAVATGRASTADQARLMDYFESAATSLINQPR